MGLRQPSPGVRAGLNGPDNGASSARTLTRREVILVGSLNVCGIAQGATRRPWSNDLLMKRLKASGRHHVVLHIGGNATDARTIQTVLAESTNEHFDVDWVPTLADGLARLTRHPISAVLLDLLSEGPGIDQLETLVRAVPDTPILVVGTDVDDERVRQVVRAGANDYLLKQHLDRYWLPRALLSAIERKLAEQALFEELDRAKVTLNSIGDAVLSTDVSGRVIYLNTVAETMTGWSRAEAADRPLEDVLQLVDGTTRERVDDPLRRAMRGNHSVHLESNVLLIRRDGAESPIEDTAAPIHDRRGSVTGAVIVFRDMSAIQATAQHMAHLASHDPLTDLPNRLLLQDRLGRALALAHRHQQGLAVLFLDVDHFKDVNDSLGHALGDQLLQAVGQDVAACLRSSDTVSRHGGDEFVVVLAELTHAEDAALGAQKILAAVDRPRQIGGHDLHVTASIGISVFPDDGEDAETLMKSADTAMYYAKDEGRHRSRFFEPDMNVRAIERRTILAGLRGALKRREFVLHYQPKMNLQTGAMVGGEALLRWQRPDHGLVEPAQFVPIAEACGLIVPIGRWVIHEACRQAQAWQTAGLRQMPVSVNVSAVEFRSQGFLEHLRAMLKETGLDPRHLELELTESLLMAPREATAVVLRTLKGIGVQLAIDDFGVGYSSLSYLSQFPIDALKVDQSFVQRITSSPRGDAIVRAVIGVGQSLGHRVIAEGVETGAQLAFLQAEHCGEGQGYYFSRPLVAEQFAQLMGNRRHALVKRRPTRDVRKPPQPGRP
jgi:diguanylate cyclase (GGDEF)-like protein/PAS domain S-box-containing protein